MLDGNGLRCNDCKQGLHKVLIKNCKKSYLRSLIVFIEAFIRKKWFSISRNLVKYIFVSDFSRMKHQEFSEVTQNYDLIYNAVPDSGLVKNIEEVYKSDHDVIYVGRLSKEKGIQVLLSTFSAIGANLDLYGSGPERILVEEYASKYKNITYHGVLKREEVVKTIKKYK